MSAYIFRAHLSLLAYRLLVHYYLIGFQDTVGQYVIVGFVISILAGNFVRLENGRLQVVKIQKKIQINH